jgi:RNA polymerase sigma factor (sigma-70 family)
MLSPSLALLRTQSDQRLAALAADGHERAFEAIVERYRRPLLGHARRLLSDARAEDAVQQALLAAWAALRRGDDVEHVGAWLHRIVHNTALNARRGPTEDPAELGEVAGTGGAPHDELERRLAIRETLTHMAELPERQRAALLHTALQGRSHQEVAAALGLTDGAVRQLVHRARTALRAAATALTPAPVVGWLASAGARSEPLVPRIGELVAGGASAGAAAGLVKTGAAVVAVSGAVAGSAAVYEDARVDRPSRAAVGAELRGVDRDAVTRGVEPRSAGILSYDSDSSGPGSGGSGSGESGSSGSGSGTSGSSGSGSSGSGSDSSGSSGSGSDTSGSSGSGSDSSGSSGSGSDASGSSGSGSDTSGSSGSGSSGSGSGTSGSSGPGSSGSGSGISGSSGSGSGTSGSSGSGSGTSDPSGSGASGSSGTLSDTSGSSGSGSGTSGSSGSGSTSTETIESESSGSGSSGSGS